MLGIESARNVHQDLSAFEQLRDGFLDFRHRINRGDGDAQCTGGNERSGFDLRRQDLRQVIEIAQEEAFDRQVFAYEGKGAEPKALERSRDTQPQIHPAQIVQTKSEWCSPANAAPAERGLLR